MVDSDVVKQLKQNRKVARKSFLSNKTRIEKALSIEPLTPEAIAQAQEMVENFLASWYSKYEEAVRELLVVIEDESFEDEVIEEQTNFSEILSSYRTKLKKLLKTSPQQISAQAPAACNQSFKLPKIDVPTFDGDLTKFYSFKNRFESLIHNNEQFDKVAKLHYLSSSLIGKAELVVSDFTINNLGYTEAYEHFLSIYENKRAIVGAHFSKIYETETIKGESGIRELLTRINASVRGLKCCGIQMDDAFLRFLTFLVSSKLDKFTVRDWQNSLKSTDEYPQFEQLESFLKNRTFAAEERHEQGKVTSTFPKSTDKENRKHNDRKSYVTIDNKKCVICAESHPLFRCSKFLALKPQERQRTAKKYQLCLVCLNNSCTQKASKCESKFACKCGGRHNYLLHFEFNSKNDEPSVRTNEKLENNEGENSATRMSNLCSANNDEKFILLPTIATKFKANNYVGKCRAMLDSCSQVTLISDVFVKRHNIPLKRCIESGPIKGVGTDKVNSKYSVTITLISRAEPFELEIEADVVPASALSYSVDRSLPARIYDQLRKFSLADEAFSRPDVSIQNVDILVGAEFYEACLCNETRRIEGMTLRLTHFGWTASGPIPRLNQPNQSFCGATILEINENLKKFWELEEPAQLEPEFHECIEHFKKNTRIAENGKFIVSLPFKMNRDKVADNRSLALAAFFRLEKRLHLKENLKVEYDRFLNEYLKLGHMEVAEPNENSKYYIPHREVLRESTTTPLRVVFNASSCKKGEISLNEALMVGPKVQKDLFDILLTSQMYKYALTADITKMYRMVEVDETDRDMQRIFWRQNPSEPVCEYKLKTVTYGTASGTFLATYCLQIIAEKLQNSHPVAAEMIKNNFYVDDCIIGSNDENQLVELQKIIHEALAEHNFILRKYSSNSRLLMQNLSTELKADSSSCLLTGKIGVLGMIWLPNSDSFSIKLNLKTFDQTIHPTKRIVLSFTSLIFDPLGIVAPVTLCGKLLMQSLWLENTKWDEPISENLKSTFIEYMNDLKKLSNFSVPRFAQNDGHRQLILFCDASEKSYCAAVYLRTITSIGDIHCKLLCSKTRIVPLKRKKNNKKIALPVNNKSFDRAPKVDSPKKLSIARAELCGALLGAQLVTRVASTLNIPVCDIYAFTDNTTILCWLSKPATTWKKFVASRVRKIKEKLPFKNWYYVPSQANPADLGTRSMTVDEFMAKKEFWVNGPDFLKEPNAFEYHKIPNLDVQLALEKRKAENSVLFITKYYDVFARCSSLQRLHRGIIFLQRSARRFLARKRSVAIETQSIKLTDEYDQAFKVLIRLAQATHFSTEINCLKNNLPVKKKSCIKALNPFLGEDGILRVGGRLENSDYSFEKKHPIILHAKSHFTKLLVRHVHEKYFHVGRSFLASFFSARYWIVGGRTNIFKKIIYNCVACVRRKAKTCEQIMGQLPRSRVTASHPFSTVGVDLAGHFLCKCVDHRSTKFNKIYLAIFVCFATRAVHLEIVSGLSSDKFFQTLSRFVSRRGLPSDIYSDNATNFVGLGNFFENYKSDLENYAAKENFYWHFIPASSPNFGGLWEAAVKSAKKHLLHVTNGIALTFEEYLTLFAKIEAILNSRPLCYAVNQNQETEVITPGHFLVGGSLLTIPRADLDDLPLHKRLDLLRTQVKSFWQYWSKDYLNFLQSRKKWTSEKPNLSDGSIVLVKDDNSPPFKWPLGLIEKTYTGTDNKVRVADVRFKGSVKSRAISKLVPLPVTGHGYNVELSLNRGEHVDTTARSSV